MKKITRDKLGRFIKTPKDPTKRNRYRKAMKTTTAKVKIRAIRNRKTAVVSFLAPRVRRNKVPWVPFRKFRRIIYSLFNKKT